MRIHNALDEIVNHEIKTKILRILLKYGTEWTGRQIAKELGVSPTTAAKFLKELVDEGVIKIKGAGRSYLYSLNDRNYVVKNILVSFFEKERNIFDVIVDLIKKNLLKAHIKIESAAIFGSVAKKNENVKSDIDLLVILKHLKDKKKIENKLEEISPIIAQDFQTVISPYILSQRQFRKRYKEGAPIIDRILRSHILIMGKSLERITV